MPSPSGTPEGRALGTIRRNGGTIRTSEAIRSGIQPRTLYHLRDTGAIEQVSRGVFRLADLPAPTLPDLLIVATRLPKAVICLTSALALHELTDEIPHDVHIALPRKTEQPRLDHPPLRVVRLSPACYQAGIEIRRVDGVDLRVYSPAKTVADCFKFRNQIGLETALKALKALRKRRGFDVEELLSFARICRVERVLRPYLEAIL
ncbi:MAG: type IV toxin-antitoxin system AbiEi family antitoxin domain-containing protein [Planctomycetes bacterium]|nr:type IV toxin-antitoxin system AbiEi family antitoxin domain-containing protein [Planctomycetota bacterium]